MKFKIQMVLYGIVCGALLAEITPFVEHFHFELDHLTLEHRDHSHEKNVPQSNWERAAAMEKEYQAYCQQQRDELIKEQREKWDAGTPREQQELIDRWCEKSFRDRDPNDDRNDRDRDRD